MGKRHHRPTFADIVAQVEAAPPPPERTTGYYGDTIVDLCGVTYARTEDDIDADRAQQLAAEGAIVVWDDCGCGLERLEGDEVQALVTSGRPDILHKKRKKCRISAFAAEDGRRLLYVEAAVRWGRFG